MSTNNPLNQLTSVNKSIQQNDKTNNSPNCDCTYRLTILTPYLCQIDVKTVNVVVSLHFSDKQNRAQQIPYMSKL